MRLEFLAADVRLEFAICPAETDKRGDEAEDQRKVCLDHLTDVRNEAPELSGRCGG